RDPLPGAADRFPHRPLRLGGVASAGLEQGHHLRLGGHQGPRRRDPHRVQPGDAVDHHLRRGRRRPLRARMTLTDKRSQPTGPADTSAGPGGRSGRPPVVPDHASQHPAVLVPAIKRLLRGSWAMRKWFIFAVLGATAFALLHVATVVAVMQVATSPAIGRVTENVIGRAIQAGELAPAVVLGAGLAVLGIGVARAVSVMGRRVFAAATQFDLFRLYRERLASVYAKVPLLWHRRQSTGTLLSAVYADIEATFFAMAPFPFALSTIVMLVYATAVVAQIDPVILLVMLALIIALIVMNILLQRFAAPIAVRSQRLRAEVAEIAHESFDGANVVKSLGRE